MRVDVIINPKAGKTHLETFKKSIEEALFRTDLFFHVPESIKELKKVIENAVHENSEALLICGGDGTVNVTIKPLIELRKQGLSIPPICLISSGTANDLAHELHLSKRLHQAARTILEGHIHYVDVLEIQSSEGSSYMLTNGGLGIPASTAQKVNHFRTWLRQMSQNSQGFKQNFFKKSQKLLKALGSGIYEISILHELFNWDSNSWQIEITRPGEKPFQTKAPFVLINNQARLGKNFTPAPLTLNNDGFFNVLIVEAPHFISQINALLKIRKGTPKKIDSYISFETPEITVKSLSPLQPLVFFGDGEILHENVSELNIKCLHPGLAIAIMEESK